MSVELNENIINLSKAINDAIKESGFEVVKFEVRQSSVEVSGVDIIDIRLTEMKRAVNVRKVSDDNEDYY